MGNSHVYFHYRIMYLYHNYWQDYRRQHTHRVITDNVLTYNNNNNNTYSYRLKVLIMGSFGGAPVGVYKGAGVHLGGISRGSWGGYQLGFMRGGQRFMRGEATIVSEAVKVIEHYDWIIIGLSLTDRPLVRYS